MPFSQATITDLTVGQDGLDLLVSWTSSAPDGTWFQVYLDGGLAWSGQGRRAHLPYPSRKVTVHVGAVDSSAERDTSFTSSLPALGGAGRRARLEWSSDRNDVAEWRIYGEASPGGGINWAAPIATVPATVGVDGGGFGVGGFGMGGFGIGGRRSWSYETQPLGAGTWNFGVRAVDGAGNEQPTGSAVLASAAISAPPRPPAPFGDGTRLRASVNGSTQAVLTWNASP